MEWIQRPLDGFQIISPMQLIEISLCFYMEDKKDPFESKLRILMNNHNPDQFKDALPYNWPVTGHEIH